MGVCCLISGTSDSSCEDIRPWGTKTRTIGGRGRQTLRLSGGTERRRRRGNTRRRRRVFLRRERMSLLEEDNNRLRGSIQGLRSEVSFMEEVFSLHVINTEKWSQFTGTSQDGVWSSSTKASSQSSF